MQPHSILTRVAYALVFTLIAGLALTATAPNAAAASNPVEICHLPPGNASSAQTLSVSERAVRAHLDHGDAEAPCDDRCINADACDDNDLCTADSCGEFFCENTPIDLDACDDDDPRTGDVCLPDRGCVNKVVSDCPTIFVCDGFNNGYFEIFNAGPCQCDRTLTAELRFTMSSIVPTPNDFNVLNCFRFDSGAQLAEKQAVRDAIGAAVGESITTIDAVVEVKADFSTDGTVIEIDARIAAYFESLPDTIVTEQDLLDAVLSAGASDPALYDTLEQAMTDEMMTCGGSSVMLEGVELF